MGTMVCKKCGYVWESRISKPKRCAMCGQAKWWEPRRDGKVPQAVPEVRQYEERHPQAGKRYAGPVPPMPEALPPDLDDLLAAGKVQRGVWEGVLKADKCGQHQWDEGVEFRCGLPKGHKAGKHGNWEKVEE